MAPGSLKHRRPSHSRARWGEPGDLPGDSDGGAVMAGHVSLTWLNRLHDDAPPDNDPAAAGLADLLG